MKLFFPKNYLFFWQKHSGNKIPKRINAQTCVQINTLITCILKFMNILACTKKCVSAKRLIFLWLFNLSIVSLLMYHVVVYRQNLNPLNQLLMVVIANSQASKIFNKVKGFNCLLIQFFLQKYCGNHGSIIRRGVTCKKIPL